VLMLNGLALLLGERSLPPAPCEPCPFHHALPGHCPEPCVPQCAGCTGGDDGRGGICGCPEGQACVDATCQDPQ
jgi:hypothetical protein